METDKRCVQCAKTTIWICCFECAFIFLFKVVIGLTGGSKAMLGSALFSLTDLVSSLLLIVSFQVSTKPADEGHPYGHGKIEYIISFIISAIIFNSTLTLIWFSVVSLYNIDMIPPHWIGIWASIACVSLSMIVYRMLICSAVQSDSPAMTTHAKHMRMDTLSNFAVIVAIGAAEAGFSRADSVIAILESTIILYESTKMGLKAISFLMDKSIGKEHLAEIHDIVARDSNVKAVTSIKGKSTGRGISLDIEIMLDPNMTIEECNAASGAIRRTLMGKVQRVHSVHIRYVPCTG